MNLEKPIKAFAQSLVYTAQKGMTRYMNEFIKCRCSADLPEWGMFPNAKEVTESVGAYNALRQFLHKKGTLFNEPHTCFVVGDGSTPRTGALIACRTAWHVTSIDPNLNGKEYSHIRRLSLVKAKIEDVEFPKQKHAIIVLVHSHAHMENIKNSIPADRYTVISMPCCVPDTKTFGAPVKQYVDPGIWSPKNTINIYESK